MGNLVITVAVAIRWPQYYWVLHVIKSCIYVPWRFKRFQEWNGEWYLLDFCYVTTYVTVLANLVAFLDYLGIIGHHHFSNFLSLMFRVGFTYACGTLAWSVVLFRNSLVFHSIDHLTSFFIHFSPMVYFWCLRWGAGLDMGIVEKTWPHMFSDLCEFPLNEARSSDCLDWHGVFHWCRECDATWLDFIVHPSLFYICFWAIPYYLIVFVLCKNYLARNKKETLYDIVIKDKFQ